nr:acyl-CoA dehydrogenase family protein [Conexibacter sp. W3-3-2]
MSTPTAAEPVIRLVPTQEQEMLRESVAGVTAKYGAKYMLDCHERGVPPTEMWDALSEKGFTGVNIPEEYGGGGLGMTGLALVQEELGRHGCTQLLMVVSPAIAGSIPHAPRRRGAEGPLAPPGSRPAPSGSPSR